MDLERQLREEQFRQEQSRREEDSKVEQERRAEFEIRHELICQMTGASDPWSLAETNKEMGASAAKRWPHP
jgi:hypothetical protein